MGKYDDDGQKDPKVVLYHDYEDPSIWVWEVHNANDKKCYEGKNTSFELAYEEAKAVRQKHYRKLLKGGE